MRFALRGCWRLVSPDPSCCSPSATGDATLEREGDLVIETEGVDPKYLYRMDFALRSSGRVASRNTKLVWRAFYSYNKLTDDWADFALCNDVPFFFSRVRSYGMGS